MNMMKMTNKVEIYCETSCRGKESFYYGVLVFNGIVTKSFALAEEYHDHNLMEMKSVVHGFESLEIELREKSIEASEIDLYISSQNIIKAFSDGWLKGWHKKGWVNGKGKPIKYRQEWEQIEEVFYKHAPRLVHSSKFKRKKALTFARKNASKVTRKLSKKS
jgi:ribonuclease HI|tara:strand:- start:12535 stop:13020 length:486 start_codon:yes stop_codon:yes gene_type:complete